MFAKCFIILSYVIKIILTKENCDNGKCEKILDGNYTTIEKFPHSVAMVEVSRDYRRSFCGGSVLTERIVLTAAHCVRLNASYNVFDLWSNRVYVAAGNEDVKQMNILRKIKDYAFHECYTEEYMSNDIALLFLDEDLPLGPTIKRVVITREFPVGVKKADVSGWGQTTANRSRRNSSDTDTGKKILKYVAMKIYSPRKCCKILRNFGKPWNYTKFWKPGVMCGGDRHANQYKNMFFSGDSGGALVVSGNHQIGVVSLHLTTEGFKGVVGFTNVTYYYDWILAQAKKLYRKNSLPFDENTIMISQ